MKSKTGKVFNLPQKLDRGVKSFNLSENLMIGPQDSSRSGKDSDDGLARGVAMTKEPLHQVNESEESKGLDLKQLSKDYMDFLKKQDSKEELKGDRKPKKSSFTFYIPK
jgi:hypothetical protein